MCVCVCVCVERGVSVCVERGESVCVERGACVCICGEGCVCVCAERVYMCVCVWRGVCVCVCFRAKTEDLRPQALTLQPVAQQAAYVLLLNSTLQDVPLAQSPEPGAQCPE